MTAATGTATRYDWTAEQNELVVLRVPVLDEDGVPFNVTGWTVDAKIKDKPGGTTLHTWASGDTSASGTDVELTILPATSAAWTWRGGWWRARVIHPTDLTQAHRIVEGRFRLSPD